jgi:hypothetical protein
MRKITLTILAVAALTAEAVQAANYAVVTTAPGALNVLVLIGAVVAAFGAYKVQDLVRGGLMSKSWQLFAAGFVLLALAQVVSLVESMHLAAVPTYIVPVLWTLMVAAFAYGIVIVRRTLS